MAADVRDYTIDTNLGTHTHITEASPLRIGDSFEDMKRKMIPFKIGTRYLLHPELMKFHCSRADNGRD